MPIQSNFLHHLNLPFEIELLKKELKEYPLRRYSLRNADSWPIDYKVDWLDATINIRHRKTTGFLNQKHGELNKITNFLSKKLDCVCKPVYIVQKKDTALPYHKDSEIMPCAINLLLDDHPAPITFLDFGDIEYKTALVNISRYHKVKPYPQDRHLLKICIYHKPFKMCKEILDEYIQSH